MQVQSKIPHQHLRLKIKPQPLIRLEQANWLGSEYEKNLYKLFAIAKKAQQIHKHIDKIKI